MSADWLGVAADDPYGIANLPYGCWRDEHARTHAVVRIGSYMLSLTGACAGGEYGTLFADGTLNHFLAAGRPVWSAVRAQLASWLTDDVRAAGLTRHVHGLDEGRMELPFAVADYVDFYASEHHASNVGRLFRPGTAPLAANWKHLPIGYHGRAGTVVVSGTQITRPRGQSVDADGNVVFAATKRLDIEAELAFVVGAPSRPGTPVRLDHFRDHVFGACLLNDWSARDIQAWEYVPLGPFLGKSFATSLAAWITPLDALGAAWAPPPARSGALLPYLDDAHTVGALDIDIEIRLNGTLLSRPRCRELYWTPAQMLTHMTSNGATLRTGDVFASGTVSGPTHDQLGSLLELTENATAPVTLADGARRGFLEDGDEVVMTATAPARNGPIGLAEVRGQIAGAG